MKPITIERVVPEGARVITAYDLDQCRLTPTKAPAADVAGSTDTAAAPSVSDISKALSGEQTVP